MRGHSKKPVEKMWVSKYFSSRLCGCLITFDFTITKQAAKSSDFPKDRNLLAENSVFMWDSITLSQKLIEFYMGL